MDSITTLWLDDQPISGKSVMDVLRRTGQISSLVQALVLDQTLSEVSLEPGQEDSLLKEFREEQKLENEESFQTFLNNNQLTEQLLRSTLTRPYKIVKYREKRWGTRANSLYLKHKDSYDLVSYRRIESNNSDVMQEVFFRLKDKEDSWETLSRQVPGAKPNADGRIGPIPVAQLEPKILAALRNSRPGKVIRPIAVEGKTVVVELDRFEASTFDDELRIKILQQEFSAWLQEECTRIMSMLKFAP